MMMAEICQWQNPTVDYDDDDKKLQLWDKHTGINFMLDGLQKLKQNDLRSIRYFPKISQAVGSS